mgnify:FL=1
MAQSEINQKKTIEASVKEVDKSAKDDAGGCKSKQGDKSKREEKEDAMKRLRPCIFESDSENDESVGENDKSLPPKKKNKKAEMDDYDGFITI